MDGNSAGSVTLSGMDFINYRIVKLDFKCADRIVFSPTGFSDDTTLKVEIGLGDIIYMHDHDLYLSPLSAGLSLYDPETSSEDGTLPVLEAHGTIIGLFRFAQPGEMKEELRKKLLLNQTPAILMQFLRAAISSQIAIAGFAAITFPLINMARQAGESSRRIIEMTSKEMEQTMKKNYEEGN